MIKGADVQLLPASFRAMEVSLHIEPFSLALMALCQGVAAALSGPMWGNLVDAGLSRKLLLIGGVLLWGMCTIALGFASSIVNMSVLRALNGVSVAMLLPVTQSFVYDLSRQEDRGAIFGMLYFSTNIGQVLACFFVTPISNTTVMGMDGWRFALIVVGSMSLLTTCLVPIMVVEAPRKWRPDRLGPVREARKLMSFMKIPTFGVIVCQGIFGTIPGAAFSFITMYFQYIGISDFAAALVISLHVIGDACGGLLGGVIGDALAAWSPRYGRALTAQISAVGAIPIVASLFLLVPRDVSMTTCYAGILFMLGLLSSWVAPGCICPVMCDIVPRSSLGSAYAWELAIVFCSGNLLGPMLVGVLSQRVFGYQLSTQQVGQMDPAVREANARALGKSLFFSSAVPYAVCAAIFVALFFTHHRDSRQRDLLSCSELDDEIEDNGKSFEGPRPTEASRLVATKNS
jgi:MFS family permease